MPSQSRVRVSVQKLPATDKHYEAKIRHIATQIPDARVEETAASIEGNLTVNTLRHVNHDRAGPQDEAHLFVRPSKFKLLCQGSLRSSSSHALKTAIGHFGRQTVTAVFAPFRHQIDTCSRA